MKHASYIKMNIISIPWISPLLVKERGSGLNIFIIVSFDQDIPVNIYMSYFPAHLNTSSYDL
jgi:hypothetical protein